MLLHDTSGHVTLNMKKESEENRQFLETSASNYTIDSVVWLFQAKAKVD